MPNVFWYILLSLISSVILGFTIIKTNDRKVIALYTFISGLTYLFEYIILVIFKSYVYDPNVLKNAYFDSVLGAIVSNAFTVPMVGTFIGSFNLKWKWIVFIIGVILIIEKWFLLLNIHFHFWWKIGYTAICLVICFAIAKKWNKVLHTRQSLIVRFTSIYFTGLLIQASLVFFAVALFGVYHYRIGWFENPTRDHVAFATAYIILLTFLFSLVVTFRIRWLFRIGFLLITLPLDWTMWKYGILHLTKHWSIIYFFILRLVVLIIIELFSRKCLNIDEQNIRQQRLK